MSDSTFVGTFRNRKRTQTNSGNGCMKHPGSVLESTTARKSNVKSDSWSSRKSTAATLLSLLLLTAVAVAAAGMLVMPHSQSASATLSESTLTIKSRDTDGNPISGYWTVLYDGNGNVVKTGFTPATFTLQTGQQYRIGMGNFGSYSFDHWLDSASTANPRSISINASTQLTAVYRTSATFPIIHMSDTTTSYGVLMDASKHKIAAEWVKPGSQLIGDKIDSITLRLQRVNFPTGAASVAVFDANMNFKKSFGDILAGAGSPGSNYHSDIPNTMTDIEFKLPATDPLYTIAADDRIGIFWTGGSGNAGNVSVMMDKVTSDSIFDGQNTQRVRGTSSGWITGDVNEDLYMILKQTHA